eukprot:CCRYP_003317-RA/>CCRYP_003317-RA protein AED:0.06 eAED:0.06 QI:0/1/0.5/1/1/1/2/198/460
MYFKYSLFAAVFFAGGVDGLPGTNPPSTSPSKAPSTSPTKSPSKSPTTSPSRKPSASPSSQPSSQPSSEPSSKPSRQPSSEPSQQPSSEPSQQPSSQPSESPSSQPSSEPSQQPSSQPSSEPSQQPSSQPSESPSAQPSSEPSSMPSCTPSQSPTPAPSVHLFYPDWSGEGFNQGCLNDGNEPAYMASNPGVYLHSTLDKCCSTHFAWNYDGCMGKLDDTCARALWYPDWEGTNTGCVRDGNEPLYMTQNNVQYLFSTKADCCKEHYSWNLVECMGTSSATSGNKYYPDWLGDDTCKNDGAAPTYMAQNPTMWLHDTLSSCCTKNYGWKMSECMNGGNAPAPSPGSGLYYPDWTGSNEGCLNDGNEPDYMAANPTLWMHSTLDSCCKKNYSYNLSSCTGAAASSGSLKWYMSWDAKKCVQDCVGAAPCGGAANSWDLTYDTQSKCCSERMWWDITACKAV